MTHSAKDTNNNLHDKTRMLQDVIILKSVKDQEISLNIAKEAVRIAVEEKRVIETPRDLPAIFQEKHGVFTTAYLKSGDQLQLRGCIGNPYPTMSLVEAIIQTAHDTVTGDPRFSPVTEDELEYLSLELEILTQFIEIEYGSLKELLEQITVGKDGLMLSSKKGRGLLLPPVPIKYGWDAFAFVNALCRKALVPIEALLQEDTKIFKFQAQIITEQSLNLSDN